MHAPGAGARIPSVQLLGRQRVAGLGVEISLQQPDDTAAAQVDGRNELHQQASRKFRRMRAPTPAERSGWNCVPWKLPWLTAAVNGPP